VKNSVDVTFWVVKPCNISGGCQCSEEQISFISELKVSVEGEDCVPVNWC
jgi:hypothetical protein